MTEKITNSRLASMRKCPRSHWYRYELGLARIRKGDALRLGSAVHLGLELFANGSDATEAIEGAIAGYETTPSYADEYDWRIEEQVVANLLAGYFWWWQNDKIIAEHIEAEQDFDLPLRNPDTNRASQNFRLAGVIDGIVKLADGRLAQLEHKTTSADIGSDAPYWLRLRIDPQVSTYILAARELGYDVQTTIYNVIRKPTIKPRRIPVLDEHDRKIVIDEHTGERVYKKEATTKKMPVLNDDGERSIVDAHGEPAIKKDGTPADKPNAKKGWRVYTTTVDVPAEPRQSADAAKGWHLETRPETPEEYGERLLADITTRGEFYYQRREIPRLHDQLDEHQREVWQQAKQLREAQINGRFYRSPGQQTCDFCDFAALCQNNIAVEPNGEAPGGYEFKAPHSELAKHAK